MSEPLILTMRHAGNRIGGLPQPGNDHPWVEGMGRRKGQEPVDDFDCSTLKRFPADLNRAGIPKG